MNETTPSQDNGSARLDDKSIYVVGPRKLQNDLMVFFLQRETGAKCLEDNRIRLVSNTDDAKSDQPALVFLDCLDKNLDECLAELDSGGEKYLSQHLVALFNVTPGLGIEESVIKLGVRGVFYRQDPMERFPKAVRAIFGGELWVSREIMSKCILDNKDRSIISRKDITSLTPREVEILSMVAAGAKNEEIADTLCISPNTVKTHVYNIFKKINVPNRLQAALWAAKNL